MHKNSLSSQMLFISVSVFLIIFVYRNSISKENYEIPKYVTFKKSIIENNTFKNNTDDTGRLKELSNAITEECNKSEICEVKNIYKYVTKIPYKIGENNPKSPVEVIATNSGDCDEKSFLLATLLKEKQHNSLLIFTKQNEIYHTFLGIEITNDHTINQNSTFLKINNQRYYYAETTLHGWEIGQFNGYEKKDIIGIYNVGNNKNISLKKVEFIKKS